jgi:hypothetical protein
MATHRRGSGAARRSGAKRQVPKAKVREVVTAIAAEVIAETVERLARAPRPQAIALRMSTRRRSARTQG